jgi:hypothetical protein
MHRPILVLTLLAACCFLLSGCASKPKQAQGDPVTAAMKKATANSAARVMLAGRVDWEVTPQTNEYWAHVPIQNVGGDGPVAVRVSLRTAAAYVGTAFHTAPPQYLNMKAGENATLNFTGPLPANESDKALDCDVQMMPRAANQPKTRSPLMDIPGAGGRAPTSADQMPQGGTGDQSGGTEGQ